MHLVLVLAALAPALAASPASDSCNELARRLVSPRKSSVAELRLVLDAIGAEYPNDQGLFVLKPPPPMPKRKRGEPAPVAREPDWLQDLAKATLPPELEQARKDAIAITTDLRALAATRRYDKVCNAPRILLDFAFEHHGGAFRDEVGRQVRGMGSVALPTLIRMAFGHGKSAKGQRRYANYQLDRMDRQRPETVMAQVHDDPLRAEILTAYGETRPATAVAAVLGECDAVSPRVRRAARWAWMEYVTRKPPDPPKRKLKLTGGKETDEEKELYLTYRELADLEIRRQWPALMNEPADPSLTLRDLSQRLFDHQDKARLAKWDALFSSAQEAGAQGDWSRAVGIYNWILANDPFYARRGQMVGGLREHAERLLLERKWSEAAGWLRQARALGDGESQRELEARIAMADVMAQAEQGQVSAATLERAKTLNPADPELRKVARAAQKRRWAAAVQRHGKIVVLLAGLVAICWLAWRRTHAEQAQASQGVSLNS